MSHIESFDSIGCMLLSPPLADMPLLVLGTLLLLPPPELDGLLAARECATKPTVKEASRQAPWHEVPPAGGSMAWHQAS